MTLVTPWNNKKDILKVIGVLNNIGHHCLSLWTKRFQWDHDAFRTTW